METLREGRRQKKKVEGHDSTYFYSSCHVIYQKKKKIRSVELKETNVLVKLKEHLRSSLKLSYLLLDKLLQQVGLLIF